MEPKNVVTSKINLTQLVTVSIGLAAMLGYIPEEHQTEILSAALVFGGAITTVLRTWFTGPALKWFEW